MSVYKQIGQTGFCGECSAEATINLHPHPNFTTGQTSIHFPQWTHPSPITATPSSIVIASFLHCPIQTPHPRHLRARRMDNSTLCINLRALFSVSLRAVTFPDANTFCQHTHCLARNSKHNAYTKMMLSKSIPHRTYPIWNTFCHKVP